MINQERLSQDKNKKNIILEKKKSVEHAIDTATEGLQFMSNRGPWDAYS